MLYIDASTDFTNHKLHTYFGKKNIAVVFASSLSHKSVGLIDKSNDILQQAFRKMRELREEEKNALFWAALQVNSWMIEHLDYSFVEIITRI